MSHVIHGKVLIIQRFDLSASTPLAVKCPSILQDTNLALVSKARCLGEWTGKEDEDGAEQKKKSNWKSPWEVYRVG